jgi:hypothetical protein
MPFKTDNLKIDCVFFDRRTKILPCQKLMIPFWHSKGESIRNLARKYNVNKRLIQFILFPERHKKNLADRAKRGGTKQYYDREEHNQAMKEHRRYKYNLLKNTI